MIWAFCALWRVLAFVGGYTFSESVSVDAEHDSRVREVLLISCQGFLNVELFEFAERLIQQDVALQHFVDQSFESGMNQSSFPVSNLYASK